MKKYYLMAIDKDNSSAINNLGNYYQYIDNNYDLMKKYYLMGIDKGNIKSKNYLIDYYMNKHLDKNENIELFELFNIYINIDLIIMNIINNTKYKYLVLYSLIGKPILEYLKFKNIICHQINKYINKINILTKKDKCPICLDDNDCIPTECAHYYCYYCYPIIINLEKCAICNTEL